MNDSVSLDGAWMMEPHLLGKAGPTTFAFESSSITAVVFLAAGECVAALDLIYFLILLCRKKIQPEYFTIFRMSLLFNSIIQLVSTPVVLVVLRSSDCYVSFCQVLLLSWSMSRRCGAILYLLVAMEYMLIKKNPALASELQRVHWSLPVVLALNFIGSFFPHVNGVAMFFGALGFILTCLMSGLAYTLREQMDKYLVLVIWYGLSSYIIFYFPSFVAECMILAKMDSVPLSVYVALMGLGNLRLITEGRFRRIIASEPPETDTQVLESGRVNPEPASFDNVNFTNDAGQSFS